MKARHIKRIYHKYFYKNHTYGAYTYGAYTNASSKIVHIKQIYNKCTFKKSKIWSIFTNVSYKCIYIKLANERNLQ